MEIIPSPLSFSAASDGTLTSTLIGLLVVKLPVSAMMRVPATTRVVM